MRAARVLSVAVVALLGLAVARADDGKKKPGMWDFGGWKTPVQHQRDAAKNLVPGTFDLTPAAPHAGAPRPVRLRIYADSDYRHAVLSWQHKVRAQIDRINRVVEPVFAVSFEIESLRDWNASHVGSQLEPVVGDLERLDPAQDVDWVVGLVTPFRGVATSIHQLGAAQLLARHFVMRAMDDEQEAQALAREFQLLSPEERDNIYANRKSHKETVIFLHEWAHTMGALHDEDHAIIMNPLYDPKQARFSGFEQRLLLLVLERRLARTGEAFPESQGHDLEALLANAPAEEGSDKDRAILREMARRRAAGGGTESDGAGASAVVGPTPLPPADAEAFNRAVAAVNGGHREEAWTQLQPLVRRHPREVAIGTLACYLVAGQPHAEDARAACDAAAALAPKDARPLLEAAAAYVRIGDTGRAAPLVVAGAARAAEAAPDAKLAVRVAQLAGAVGAISAGDAALARVAREPGELGEKIMRLAIELEGARRRLALPYDAARWGVPPEKEPAFAAAFWETSSKLSSGGPAAVRARLRDFAAAYPDAPGTDLLACEVEVRAGHAAAATKRCEAALAKFDETVRAHYVLGFIAAQAGRDAAAEKHLRRAIKLDPEDDSAWRELAHLYKATRANQSLVELRAQHKTLLSSPLPE